MDTNEKMDTTENVAPSTSAPDGSALALEAVGQGCITMGWIFALIFFLAGAWLCASDFPVLGVPLIVLGILCLISGYSSGARKKATAKAAINATRAAERTKRIEQMMVNMVSDSGQISLPTSVEKMDCPKCGAKIPVQQKFCSECGASIKTTCAQCGKDISAGSKFCPECGAKC